MQSTYQHTIREFFELPKGFNIENPESIIRLQNNIVISRKALKHLIEQRKREGFSLSETFLLIKRILSCMKKSSVTVPSGNRFVSARPILAEHRAILVVYEFTGKLVFIVTAFYRSEKKFWKLKK